MTSYTLFADESGTHERYLILGAILLPSESVAPIESVLNTYANAKGFRGREFSWKKCSPGEVDRYCAFAELFWHTWHWMPPVAFRCVAIDKHRNPLQHVGYGCTTTEDGFYKFYHHFLTASVKKAAWRASHFVFNLASTSDSYPHRTEVLEKTVSGAIRRAIGGRFEQLKIVRDEPKASRIHQLADVLMGAVSYRANGRASFKEQICETIESYVGKSLTRDFFPAETPFNVWWWASKNQARWAPGSRGTVR